MIKKTLVFLITSVCLTMAQYNPPMYLWTGTLTIESFVGQSDLSLAHDEGDALISSLQSLVTSKHPSVIFEDREDERDDDVRETLWSYGGLINQVDLLYVGTHGGHGSDWTRIVTYNSTGTADARVYHGTSNGACSWGGYGNTYTKWVILRACQALRPIQGSYEGLFSGVHSILGYNSDYYYFDVYCYDCHKFLWWEWCNDNVSSTEILSEFSKEWITNEKGIGYAWIDAHRTIHYEKWTLNERCSGSQGQPGIEPTCLWIGGSDLWDGGKYFNGCNEKFAKTIDRLLPSWDTGDWDYDGYAALYSVMGEPTY